MQQYCPVCGQPSPRTSDYSVRAHLGELVEQLTSTDGKTLRTVWALIARPGQLTADHFAGRRARYLRPIQLFFLVNVLLFFAAPRVPLFSYSLEKYLHNAPPSPVLVNRLIRDTTPAGHTHDASAGGNEFASYQRKFDSLVDAQRKTLIILFAPALALFFLLVVRTKDNDPALPTRFGQHLVYSLHLLSFVWLVLTGVGVIARFAGGVLRIGEPAGILLGVIAASLLAWGAAYLLRSLRKVYDLAWRRAIIVAAATIITFSGLLVLYRGLLFFTTYYAL